LPFGEQIAPETGVIKSAAGASSYLVEQTIKRADFRGWYDGIIEGAGAGQG
jgi:hypothetical protein